MRIKPLLDERSEGGVRRDVVPLVHLDEHPGTYSLCFALASADDPTELPLSSGDGIAPGVDDHLPGVPTFAKESVGHRWREDGIAKGLPRLPNSMDSMDFQRCDLDF